MPARILITGATGFVGQYLTQQLSQSGYQVRALVRANTKQFASSENVEVAMISDISICDWHTLLQGVDYVIHCAALAHVPNVKDKKALLWQINVETTAKLAKACETANTKRFIFLSSIKVLGEETHEKPFTIKDIPNPQDLYGESKWAAEQAIQACATLNWTIIRAPLMYGDEVKGNLKMLIKALQYGLCLPFKGIKNQRSLLSLNNLARLIEICLTHPAAIQQTFLAADREPISTPELIQQLALAHGLKAHLFYCPRWCLKAIGGCVGRTEMISKLIDSLIVDTKHTRQQLDWHPLEVESD